MKPRLNIPSPYFRGMLACCIFVLARPSPAGAGEPIPPLPAEVHAEILVTPQHTLHPVSPHFLGNNLYQGGNKLPQVTSPQVRQRVRDMGVQTIRFPNGCFADRYNWLAPASGELTVEEFIDFCDAVGAEPYYTLNLQGGTEGLSGAPPAGADLNERIRYRHTAPNPCGWTDYHFGTLAEAVQLVQTHTIQRAINGQTPITSYELGNENWGQSRTDWPFDVYGRTCEVYAATIRQVVEDARQQHPGLANLDLHIVMVGFPTMGNNQDPFAAVDRAINVGWTAEVNRLGSLGLIDAVQEHFYPYGNNNGDTLLWAAHNLHNILALRYGEPNERLDGYVDPELVYEVPVEITEWNLKCWGTAVRQDLPLINGGFEQDLSGWSVSSEPVETGSASASPSAARRGANGLLIQTGDAHFVEVCQVIPVGSRMPAPLFGAAVWARTGEPGQLHVKLRQANAGEHAGQWIMDRTATQTGMWERVVAAGAPFADTTDIELVLRLEGAGSSAFIDEIRPLHWTTTSNLNPLAADTFEQDLFTVDALRELLLWPTPRTHWHHLFGNYPCPTLTAAGEFKHQSAAFRLLADRIGDAVVETACTVPTLSYDTSADAYATDFNALAPDMEHVPALAVVATRREDRLHLLMINRTSDRPIETTLRLRLADVAASAEVRSLIGEDFDTVGAAVTTAQVALPESRSVLVPPHSAQVLSVDLLDERDTPVFIEPSNIEMRVTSGESRPPVALTISGAGNMATAYTLAADAPWITLSETGGTATAEPQTVTMLVKTQHLAPGVHLGTVELAAPDAWNSPQRASVRILVEALPVDFDRDGDVDMDDFSRFQNCISGSGNHQTAPACAAARLDGDPDVDASDFAIFRRCLSGSRVAPPPDCLDGQ